MGVYNYTEYEKQMNKVLKSHQDDLDLIGKHIDAMNASADARIAESEGLLRSLGYSPEDVKRGRPVKSELATPVATADSWANIVQQAEERYPYDVALEDLLSRAEFESAYKDLANINRQFRQSTSLEGIDLSIMILAAALQTLRWILMPEIGKTVDKAKRMTDKEGEQLVKKLKEDFVAKHKDWSAEKHFQGKRLRESEGKTWKEIVFGGVPYDVIKGTKDVFGTGFTGKTHRYKTLGHDPMLGWLFGTSNILTDTMTLNNLLSYRVNNKAVTNSILLIPQLVMETSEQIQSDKYKLPAAIFRQALHYKSDMYTKMGLPVPVLGVFNESLAGELYSSQYDFLCFARDSVIEATSATLSILTNMVISLIHSLYYNEHHDGERKLFDVRTRKILLYSNALASSGNVAITLITKNMKTLDVGGLAVTISRLYSDARFIAKAKEEFIQSKLDDNLRHILNDANEMLRIF